MRVDFFIVGAPKAGTTSLYHYLNEHPEIEMSSKKEPDYFSDRYIHEQGMYYGNERIETLENYPVQNFNNLQMLDKTISSSFHETEDLANCAIEFNYHLLSPVFSSISKLGYEGRGFDVNHIDKTVIGMGGVTSKNIEAFKTLGFKGVGVLGGIWNSSVPIESFEKMKKYFE